MRPAQAQSLMVSKQSKPGGSDNPAYRHAYIQHCSLLWQCSYAAMACNPISLPVWEYCRLEKTWYEMERNKLQPMRRLFVSRTAISATRAAYSGRKPLQHAGFRIDTESLHCDQTLAIAMHALDDGAMICPESMVQSCIVLFHGNQNNYTL